MKSTDKQTDNWIKQNGMDAKSFNATDIELLQAQKIAHRLLKDYSKLLGQNEAGTLNNFNHAMNNGRMRSKITQQQCYTVMNIGKAVNRKIFKANKG